MLQVLEKGKPCKKISKWLQVPRSTITTRKKNNCKIYEPFQNSFDPFQNLDEFDALPFKSLGTVSFQIT